MTAANIAHVQSMYAAFGRGDIASLLAGCTPDINWQTVGRQKDFPTLGPRKGIAQVLAQKGRPVLRLHVSGPGDLHVVREVLS